MIAIFISVSLLLGSQGTKQKDFDKIEAVNSIENMIEWMKYLKNIKIRDYLLLPESWDPTKVWDQ